MTIRNLILGIGIVQLVGCTTVNPWTKANSFPPDPRIAEYRTDSPGRDRMTQFNAHLTPEPPKRPPETLQVAPQGNPIQQIAASVAKRDSVASSHVPTIAQVSHLETLPAVEQLPNVQTGGTVVAPLADAGDETIERLPEVGQEVTEEVAEPMVATMTPSMEVAMQFGESVPIDFRNALAIATGENPQVVFAGARIREAYAQETAARSLWLPHFRVGASFYNHNGQLQNAAGNVLDVDRGAG
ncbi:MAG: hypothetical protein AAF497_20905, partial [Planctomycetota bacterium]